MQTSSNGIDLIKKFEGCQLTAYLDQGDVLTIGWGHTGSDVYPGMTITQESADALLDSDCEVFCLRVNDCVKVPLNQNQFDALVSFCYNLGVRALVNSTLLMYLNQSDFTAAANEFPRWVKVNGVPTQGLLNRRLAEQALFNTPVTA